MTILGLAVRPYTLTTLVTSMMRKSLCMHVNLTIHQLWYNKLNVSEIVHL